MLEKSLAGPLGLLVKFSTLQEYGVDKPFFLENDNVDSSQRNVVFLSRGEKATQVVAIAGMYLGAKCKLLSFVNSFSFSLSARDLKVDYVDIISHST